MNTDTLDMTLIDFGCGDLLNETLYKTFSSMYIAVVWDFNTSVVFHILMYTEKTCSSNSNLQSTAAGYFPDHTGYLVRLFSRPHRSGQDQGLAVVSA